MSPTPYIFDPTADDKLSAIRGIGRYMQMIREAFPHAHYTAHPETIKHPTEPLIIPFWNFIQQPPWYLHKFPKTIVVIHDCVLLKYPIHFPVGLRGNISVFLNKILASRVTSIVTDSHASKKDIISLLHIPDDRISVIYPYLPDVFTLPKALIKVKSISTKMTHDSTFSLDKLPKKYVVYVGDTTWNKNLVNLAKAVILSNVPCVLVGATLHKALTTPVPKEYHPWERFLYSAVRIMKEHPDLFITTGYISDEKMSNIYTQAIANMLSSYDEGFGMSFLESAYYGTPSILSDISVFHEVSQEHALFINPHDIRTIADAILDLGNNTSKRIALGMLARNVVKGYTNRLFYEKLLHLL